MAPDNWAALAAAVLLAAAFAAGVLARGRAWPWTVLGLRVAGAVALLLAMIWLAVERGPWSWADGRLVAAGLAFIVVVVNLLLGMWLRSPRMSGAGPASDLLAAGLAVCVVLLPESGGAASAASTASTASTAPAMPWQLSWILTLLGAGTLGVAGSAALTLAVRALLITRGRGGPWPPRANLHDLLYWATALACVALGAGLTIALWWAWQTSGALDESDPRRVWAAAATVLAIASLWAVRLGRQSGRWSAALAGVAAALAITGLLAGTLLQQAMAF